MGPGKGTFSIKYNRGHPYASERKEMSPSADPRRLVTSVSLPQEASRMLTKITKSCVLCKLEPRCQIKLM